MGLLHFTVALLAAATLGTASAQVSQDTLDLEVPGDWGRIEVRPGREPLDEVERFAQLTRAATGHIFNATELQSFLDSFCNSGRVQCAKAKLGEPLSLELRGVGTITVLPGQSPAEAIDTFLVRAKAAGIGGIAASDVEQVMDYFCAQKACAVPLQPLELPVSGMGTVSVAVGEEVADAVERFAYACQAKGLPLDRGGAAQIAARLCTFKTCHRPLRLPPFSLEVPPLGVLEVPFGVDPADAVEAFAATALADQGTLLAQEDVDAVMGRLCASLFCRRSLVPVAVDVGGVGPCTVAVGQEPADAARAFLDAALKAGHAVDAAGAEGLMAALCGRKACRRPLDLRPAELEVRGVGTLAVPLGTDPTAAVEAFLEQSRAGGLRLGGQDAAAIMRGVCGLASLAGPCVRPLDVRPLQLEVTEVGTIEVPFGEEPAGAVDAFLLQARAAGTRVDEENARAIMENLCARKACNVPLDLAPLSLEVTGVGTLVVPFNQEPALFITKFLLEARAAGHAIDASGAQQLMEAACARKTCLVPIDLSAFTLPVEGVGVFKCPFGTEPSVAVARFVDQVVAAGGSGLVTAKGAAMLMEAVCAKVTCFVPLDTRPVEVPVESVGVVSVPFGEDPTQAVAAFLRQAAQAGALPDGPVDPDLGARLLAAVCDAGRGRAAPGALAYCHRPLDLSPFTLQVAEVGVLEVPFGAEPAESVASFVRAALDQGVPLDATGVDRLMEVVCGSLPCARTLDTSPTTLNVTDMGVVEVPFGAEPAAAVRKFISHSVYLGTPVTVDGARAIMENLCSRTQCRQPLDLDPTTVAVEGLGRLVCDYTEVPQSCVRAFGNLHRLSVHMMQQVMNALCAKTWCEAEIPKKEAAA